MLHIGLLIPSFVGHLRPASVLARALARRGHRVRMLSFPDAAPLLTKSGVELTTFGESRFPIGEWDRRVAALGAAEGREIYRQVFRLLLDQSHCIAADLPNVLRRLRLDGLVVDQLCYGAESVAESLALPMVLACNALPFHRESRVPQCFRPWNFNPSLWARLRNKFEGAWSILVGWEMSLFYLKHRRSLGLRQPSLSHLNEVPPSLAQVAQIPEFFDFPRLRLPSHFHYTGPWLEPEAGVGDDFPWERLDGRPLIYASLGTLQNRVMRWHETIAVACEGLNVQLVVGLGRSSHERLEPSRKLSDRAIVAAFAPQRELINRAALLVTHAGLNSALEGLSAGVPMVAIPISHDQPGVASRLRRLGVAEVVPAEKLNPARLRAAMARILDTPTHRSRAVDCANLLRKITGSELAADVVERAFDSRTKVERTAFG